MEREQSLQEIAVLRHSMHINNRLRLETIASLSRLFREYHVPIKDELLAEVILALPLELNGTDYETLRQNGNHSTLKFDGPPVPPVVPTDPPQPPLAPQPPQPPQPPEPPQPPNAPHA